MTTDFAHFINVACTVWSKITSWAWDLNSWVWDVSLPRPRRHFVVETRLWVRLETETTSLTNNVHLKRKKQPQQKLALAKTNVTTKPWFSYFMTSSQESDRSYSCNPRAHTGQISSDSKRLFPQRLGYTDMLSLCVDIIALLVVTLVTALLRHNTACFCWDCH